MIPIPLIPGDGRKAVVMPDKQTHGGEAAVPNAVEVVTSLVARRHAPFSERTLLDAVYEALCIQARVSPGRHPRLTWELHKADLLQKASVGHVEGKHSMDFAWPAKRIGLRVVYASERAYYPDSRVSDCELQERGWLMFVVDPRSKTFDEQHARVVAVIKRVGPYSGVLR